jgi:hypothetical protein
VGLNKVFLDLTVICALILTSLLLLGCSGSGSGYAPGSPVVPTPISGSPYQTNIKYGSQVQVINGWELNFDSSDSIRTTTTSNGWKIEVKYE